MDKSQNDDIVLKNLFLCIPLYYHIDHIAMRDCYSKALVEESSFSSRELLNDHSNNSCHPCLRINEVDYLIFSHQLTFVNPFCICIRRDISSATKGKFDDDDDDEDTIQFIQNWTWKKTYNRKLQLNDRKTTTVKTIVAAVFTE